MLNRTLAPKFHAIEEFTLIRPQEIQLDNGCKIFYFNSGEQELVRLEWIFNNLNFITSRPLSNIAVNTLLAEGTTSRTAAQIASEIDFYGAFLQVEYGADHSQVTLYTLNKHLKATLAVIKDILINATFPEKELQTYIRNQQQKLQVSLQKNDVVGRRTFNKALYEGTIYGFAPEAEDYAQLKQDDLLLHYEQQYQPANCTLVIAGKVDENVMETISDFFSDWQNRITADFTRPDVNKIAGKLIYIEKPNALQSAVRLGTSTINSKHPDFPGLQVLNTVLGGYFGSRLMANIREDKGYTYGIGSAIVSMKKTGTFFIATEVGAEVCREAIQEIEKEINLLKTVLIPEEELSLVRNYMLGSLLGSLENVFSHADKFKNLYFSNVDYSYYDRYAETVKNITSEELKALANQYFDFDGFVKVIVGKY
ncbi:M16 family metallopeptidase [Mucilaginibacter arboris]|uniref:Insulinase family protein n=1 Tax=Mucilaginibacter arboris TaxID=2682090 RepID=A0A7K1T070_9SPHI|nr:pitrilysin family protein [Mucilaginibacter arboris]MVN22918.1 insulinase family protein [Mucilaginibacter arboris]